MLSPQIESIAKTVHPKQKLITNITGKPGDKLKLTRRLNEAVNDLIKMGQKYRDKSQLIATKVPQSRDFAASSTQYGQEQSSMQSHQAHMKSAKVHSILDALSSSKFNENKLIKKSNL